MTDMICCPLESGDGECRAKVDLTEIRKAAKEHRCGECSETIKRGARYEHNRALWEGSWSTSRTCLSCVEIRNHFQCGGWIYGQLWDDLEENFFPDMKAGGPCMEGLSPEAKARLFERRMKWLLEQDQ
jgi:hypothetical protein